MKLSIINGPNLNLLGQREPEIYGSTSFEAYLEMLKKQYPQVTFSYFQSNVEGELINEIQRQDATANGIILNAGGYTHTSVSLADAVSAIAVPVVEVHISNLLRRESFRHTSLISPHCKGSIFGFGLPGYALAVDYFLNNA